MKHICKNMELFGVSVPGAFAEYACIRWDCTFPLDESLSYEAACMFEPMGAGVHGVEAAEVAGKAVLVSGCGPIGPHRRGRQQNLRGQTGDCLRPD